MTARYQHGSRRRKITVLGTMATPPAGVSVAARSRVVVVPRFPRRKPSYESYVRIESTPLVVGGETPPSHGGGGSPRPIGPNIIIGVAPRRRLSYKSYVQSQSTKTVTGGETPPSTGGGGSPRPVPPNLVLYSSRGRRADLPRRAVFVKSRYVQPPIDGLPNTVFVVNQPHRRLARPSVAINPIFKWGINHGRLPNAPVVVPRHAHARVRPAAVVSSPPTRGKGFAPARKPIVVVRPTPSSLVVPHRPITAIHTPSPHHPTRTPVPTVVRRSVARRRAASILLSSRYDATHVVTSYSAKPIVVPRPARVKRLRGLVAILPADAFELAPPWALRPIVVPSRLNGARSSRTAVVAMSRTHEQYKKLPAFAPFVVPRLPRAKAAPWVFTSQFLQFTLKPAEHHPSPRVAIVNVPRRSSRNWPAPNLATSILQPDDERYTKPWDLIAACIAWLRSKPEIVSMFDDDAASPVKLKFTSDVEPPRTGMPYAVFSEPDEVEHYETSDGRHRVSSTVLGAFQISVYSREKLLVRQYADSIADALNDAPLVFTDGVLVYLRRSERRFPSMTTPGPTPDVTAFKRIVEFNYVIERYFQ